MSILTHNKQSFRIIMKTDSFDYVKSRVFSQFSKDRLLHFMFFFSKNPNSAKCNYKIYDKELSAIIKCFKQ